LRAGSTNTGSSGQKPRKKNQDLGGGGRRAFLEGRGGLKGDRLGKASWGGGAIYDWGQGPKKNGPPRERASSRDGVVNYQQGQYQMKATQKKFMGL